MGRVIADISMSLDGFVAGPDDGPGDLPIGRGGERLHRWMFELASWRAQVGKDGGGDRDGGGQNSGGEDGGGQDSASAGAVQNGVASDLMEEYFRRSGAILIGRRMFDHGEPVWGDEPPFRVPVFVLTHRPRAAEAKRGGTSWNFVLDGVASAVAQATAAAGERDVAVMGGGQVISACLAAGLLDELRLHLVPILLGGGVRLFADSADPAVGLEQTRVVSSPGVTHLFYTVRRPTA
ncbi:dihydrofolate reductase family protein [Catenulispora yoronensis]|uniref:Dihydrofolate reductase family protein n=1 Tax=Catenulispora yoronensis TaxID=450799 RepID=A0ABN2VCL9_9ACTN